MWAAGDSQARGFLIGGTAGRTTLAGEGLQHQDGHSQLVMTAMPNCVAYDPAYAYELAVIVQDGMRRMYQEQESVFYYITCMNENYAHPAMPAGVGAGHLERHVSAADRRPRQGAGHAVRLGHDLARSARGGGAAREGLRRAGRCVSPSRASASCARMRSTSSAGICCIRRETAKQTYIRAGARRARTGPFIAATDYMKTVPDQIRQWVPGRYAVLGTDGFGRSDSRAELRRFFEVDRHYIVIAALKALADDGKIDVRTVTDGDEDLRHRSRETQSAVGLGNHGNTPQVWFPDIGGFKDVSVIDVLVEGRPADRERDAADHARDRKSRDGRAGARARAGSPRSRSRKATRCPRAA